MNIKPVTDDGVVYSLNEYFTKRIGSGKMLVTTRHGGWTVLDDGEYDLLFRNKVTEDSALFSRLESRGIVLTEKSAKNTIRSLSSMYSYIVPQKMLCIVNLTDRCTLNCRYCFACSKEMGSSSGRDVDYDVLKDIAGFINKMPIEEVAIEFQGGEPLVRFDLIKKMHDECRAEFPRHGKKLNSFVVVSNMTLMDEDIADYIVANNVGLCSSLDGPRELHDSQRAYFDGRGSYDVVVKWIDRFREMGKTVNLLPTVTGMSLKYGARSIIDEYLMHGRNIVNFRPVYVGERARSNNISLDAGRYSEFVIDAIEYMAELTLGGKVVYDELVRNLVRNILSPSRRYMCARRPCGAGISQLSFGVDGGIYACDLSKNDGDFRLGNARKSSFYDVYLNTLSFISNVPEFQPLCSTCAYSAYCPTCASRVFSRRRDICANTPRDFDCAVHRKIFDYLFSRMQDERYRRVFEAWTVAGR